MRENSIFKAPYFNICLSILFAMMTIITGLSCSLSEDEINREIGDIQKKSYPDEVIAYTTKNDRKLHLLDMKGTPIADFNPINDVNRVMISSRAVGFTVGPDNDRSGKLHLVGIDGRPLVGFTPIDVTDFYISDDVYTYTTKTSINGADASILYIFDFNHNLLFKKHKDGVIWGINKNVIALFENGTGKSLYDLHGQFLATIKNNGSFIVLPNSIISQDGDLVTVFDQRGQAKQKITDEANGYVFATEHLVFWIDQASQIKMATLEGKVLKSFKFNTTAGVNYEASNTLIAASVLERSNNVVDSVLYLYKTDGTEIKKYIDIGKDSHYCKTSDRFAVCGIITPSKYNILEIFNRDGEMIVGFSPLDVHKVFLKNMK